MNPNCNGIVNPRFTIKKMVNRCSRFYVRNHRFNVDGLKRRTPGAFGRFGKYNGQVDMRKIFPTGTAFLYNRDVKNRGGVISLLFI
jgi:hypothetical protein